MGKGGMDILLAYALINGGEYDVNYTEDKSVIDCLMNMYFFMMYSGINNEKQEEYFKEFEKSYKNLNEEQQEIVRQDYISIIEAQNKNKEKVKKKGMNNYE